MDFDWLWGDNRRPLQRLADTFVDWYQGPSKDKGDYTLHQFAKNLPFVGPALQAGDQANQMDDYLKNRGLNYGNVRYNSSVFGPGYGGALANTSVSAMNLYKSSYEKSERAQEKKRREAKNDYYRREMMRHRQVQTAWYRNHMRRYRLSFKKG